MPLLFPPKADSASGGESQIISIELPIKMEFKVTEACQPSGATPLKGSNKRRLKPAPQSTFLFINQGDTSVINTKTGDYVERVNKG